MYLEPAQLSIRQLDREDIRVASDPAHIRHASEPVVLVDIKNVLQRQSGIEEIATSTVHDALWLSGRARSL